MEAEEGDSWGRLLYDAVQSENAVQTRRLLREGAPWDRRGDAGFLPLHVAASRADAACLIALLEAGADPNALANGGACALALAARAGSSACCEALLGAGAEANGRDEDGVSALHWAARKERLKVVQSLLSRGADPRAIAGKTGGSPLHWAMWGSGLGSDSLEIARELISAGADPLIRMAPNAEGERLTAAEVGRRWGSKKAAEYVLGRERVELEARQIAEALAPAARSRRKRGI